MTFAWIHVLWLLALPLALSAWDGFRRRAHRSASGKILTAEAGTHTLTFSARAPAAQRPRLWLWFGLAFTIVALARPQWGRVEEPVFDQSREILLAVDLSMAGYLANPRVGAFTYNLAHQWATGLAVLGAGWWLQATPVLLLGAVLVAHVGIDRVAGYGLKYPTAFQDTHLGRIGKGAR